LATVCLAVTAVGNAGDKSAVGKARHNASTSTLTIAYYRACGAAGTGLTPASVGGDGAFFDRPLAYEALIRATPNGSLVPALATSWKIRPGNKVMTMTLRKGVRFSDGTRLDAKAVKTWLDYRARQTTGGADAWLNIRSVEALSPLVVRITLKSPNPQFALTLSSFKTSNWGMIASPKAVAEAIANPKSALLNQRTFGAGPYVLDPSETVLADHCTYVPNKFYYDKSKIKWGKIVTKLITDPSTMLAAIKAGQVDVGDGNALTIQAARSAGLKVFQGDVVAQGIHFVDPGGKVMPAFAKPQVRQAFNYAVNRKQIAQALYAGQLQPTSAPAMEPMDTKLNNYYDYNPAKARSLLAAAGYPNGFTFKMYCIGDWAGALATGPLCQAVAKDLAVVGVTAELDVPATSNGYVTDARCKCFSALGAPTNLFSAWTAYSTQLAPTASINQHGFNDVAIYKLWRKAQRLQGKAADALWRQLTRRVVTQARFLPIVTSRRSFYASSRVAGIQTASGMGFPDPIEWYPGG
jgi:peptide/nickel transport system substrate-binding protein